ncbi:MAG: cell division ATP-binding protein FtsE [Erysipelotrichaceae bacterium]|nr:cell division ATP-binding protein FtsE [Erysipelotrichaceae bacterium]
MIKFDKVSKVYKNGTRALNDISLEINEGEFVYIIGKTGSGKSTLIKILDGEEIPSSGTVTVFDTNVGKLKKRKVPLYRRNIGVVFQDFRLLPKKTVFENVAYAMEVVDTPKDQLRPRVREVLKLVELTEKSSSYPRELSGGQQQRVAIARAIANRPKILIADEPTGNLDPKMSGDIISLFERINEEEGTTVLIVTHDIHTVKAHPKRTIEIDSGHVARDRAEGLKDEDNKTILQED